MSNVLHIDTSATLTGSVSRAVSAKTVKDLTPQQSTHRDLAGTPLPQVSEAWVKARLVAPEDRTAEESEILALSDTLIAELAAADTIVIGLPLYNFGVPASLKAWMDLVARPGVTFRYTENGPEGLLKGKKAIVVFASGGVPMGAPVDFASPHLRQFLGFIGITDVTFVDTRALSEPAAA
ncbi:MAG: NAD(P)H-dependent oxidoreductase [Pseudomonadota bacterium]